MSKFKPRTVEKKSSSIIHIHTTITHSHYHHTFTLPSFCHHHHICSQHNHHCNIYQFKCLLLLLSVNVDKLMLVGDGITTYIKYNKNTYTINNYIYHIIKVTLVFDVFVGYERLKTYFQTNCAILGLFPILKQQYSPKTA